MLPVLCRALLQKLEGILWPEGEETALWEERELQGGPIIQVNLPLRFLNPKDKHCQSSKSHQGISVLRGKYNESNISGVYRKKKKSIFLSVVRNYRSSCYHGFTLRQSCLSCYPLSRGGRNKSPFPGVWDCTFPGAIYWYSTREPLPSTQVSFVTAFGSVRIQQIRAPVFQETQRPVKRNRWKRALLLWAWGKAAARTSSGKILILDFIRWEQAIQSEHPKPSRTGLHLCYFLWNFLLWFLHPCKEKSWKNIFSKTRSLRSHD